jgi:hypothetical protein
MTFLKVIVSFALAVLLLVFLNNLMAQIFPPAQDAYNYEATNSPYKKCESLSPYAKGTNYQEVRSEERAAYDKCIKEEGQRQSDKQAMDNLYNWTKSIVVLSILVVIAIFLFKKYPFYSSALIVAGVLFAISYPLFTRYGGVGLFGGASENLSESVRNKVALFKVFISAAGFAFLSLADLLFFEKHQAQLISKPVDKTDQQ